MSPDVTLKDARQVFANTVDEAAKEHGLDFGLGFDKLMKTTVAECTAEFDVIWADLMQWVHFGDDQRSKTMEIIRASLHVGSMWR